MKLNEEHCQEYVKAIARVRAMDEIDKKTGFSCPQDCDFVTQLRTCIAAIIAGVNTGSSDCILDALVMLEDLELQTRKSK